MQIIEAMGIPHPYQLIVVYDTGRHLHVDLGGHLGHHLTPEEFRQFHNRGHSLEWKGGRHRVDRFVLFRRKFRAR